MTSLLPNRWYRLAFSFSLGAFIVGAHAEALEVNKLALQQLLSGRDAMMNISLVVMADMLLSGYFCVARLQDHAGGRRLRWYTVCLRYLPSLLIFPALYYIQITLFFTLTGFDFARTTLGLAVTVTVLFGSASFFMRRLVAEKETLIELVAILTFFVCVLVICCTIFHPSAAVYNHASGVDWAGCIATLGVVLGVILLGYAGGCARQRYRQFKKSKQTNS